MFTASIEVTAETKGFARLLVLSDPKGARTQTVVDVTVKPSQVDGTLAAAGFTVPDAWTLAPLGYFYAEVMRADSPVCVECGTALHRGTHAITGEPEWHDSDKLGSSESPRFHDHEPVQ